VDAAAQDVVLGDHLLDIERIFDALYTVGGRSTFVQHFSDCRLRRRAQGSGKLRQQCRNVIVERWQVEVPRCRQRSDLFPPRGKQGLAPAFDQLGKIVENVDGHHP